MNTFNQNLLNVMICSVTTSDNPAGTSESYSLVDKVVLQCMYSGHFKAAEACTGRYEGKNEDSFIAVVMPGHELLAEKFMAALAAQLNQTCYLLRDQHGVHLVGGDGEWTQRIGEVLHADIVTSAMGELPDNCTVHNGHVWVVR